jgi:YidC/Oxa1 family membrane protein insertase
MIVIYVSTQLLSSYVSAFNIQDKNQKRLLFIFPFLFVPVVINFEAGLLVYWITTNTWTIGQQLFVRKFLPPPEPHIVESGDAGSGKKGGKPAGARALSGGDTAVADSGGNGGKPRSRKGSAKASDGGGGKASGSGAKASGGGNGGSDGGPRKAPPPSPRKKKKRSGRRR